MVNNYNEIITLTLRCNTDIKFIHSGKDSKALSFYITDYITKKALQSHNAFPLIIAASKQIEEGIFPCTPNPKYTAARQHNRDLMVKCLNKLTTHSERSGPEVATLLLGKKLHYTDQTFQKLILTPFLAVMDGKDENENFHIVSQEHDDDEDENELIPVNQKLDYLYRSENLNHVCLYAHVSHYYKTRIPSNPTNPVFYFQPNHPQVKTHCLRLRAEKGSKVPTLVGPNFPCQEKQPEEFYKLFLLVFKPFRFISEITACPTLSYTQHFELWNWDELDDLKQNELSLYLSNLHAMTGGLAQQKIERDARQTEREAQGIEVKRKFTSVDPFGEIFAPTTDGIVPGLSLGQEGLTLPKPTKNSSLGIYALTALTCLATFGGLSSTTADHDVDMDKDTRIQSTYLDQTHPDYTSLSDPKMCTNLTSMIKSQREKAKTVDLSPTPSTDTTPNAVSQTELITENMLTEITNEFTLNQKQTIAFMKIGQTLITENNKTDDDNTNQLLAYIGGPGGTGKSQMIKAVQKLFSKTNKKSWLRTSAYTGTAASNVNGSTLSSMMKDTRSAQNKKDGSLNVSMNALHGLHQEVGKMRFLIIDEVSMISTYFLSKLDARLKQAANNSRKHLPFGGVHIIFCGDFLQYGCVAGKDLHCTILDTTTESDEQLNDDNNQEQKQEDKKKTNLLIHTTGRNLWLKLNFSIFFDQQMRQNDPKYLQLLTELRTNTQENVEAHMKLLAPKIVCREFPLTDSDMHTPIIVLRNSVRIAINYAKTKSHAVSNGIAQIVCLAIDALPTSQEQPSPALRQKLWHLPDNKCEDLTGMLSFVPDMPLIIKQNLATELGICNGTICTFSRLILHPDQVTQPINPKSNTGDPIYLRFMPLMLIVKVKNPKFTQFEGLEVGEFPIFPVSKAFQPSFKKDHPSVNRTQFPVLPAYAITGYAAQGATFEKSILDL